MSDAPPAYHPPVKRSVEIAGHKTSVSLEPLFWDLLRAAADARGLPLNALVARIDAERLTAASPPGLAGALRLWLVTRLARGCGGKQFAWSGVEPDVTQSGENHA